MPIGTFKWTVGFLQHASHIAKAAMDLSKKGIEEGNRAYVTLSKTKSYEKLHALWNSLFSPAVKELPQSDIAQWMRMSSSGEAASLTTTTIEQEQVWGQLSYLSNQTVKADAITPSVFANLFRKRSSLLKDEILYFLEVVSSLFPSSSSFILSFKKATLREKNFREVIQEQATQPSENRGKKLKELAEALAQDVSSQSEDTPFFFFGGTSQENRLAKKLLERFKEQLSFDPFMLLAKKQAGEVVDQIKATIRRTSRLTEEEEQRVTKLKEQLSAAFSSCSKIVERRFPSLYAQLIKNLKLDVREIMTGSGEETEQANCYEAFFANIKENGVEKVFESWIKEVLDSSKQTVDETLRELTSTIPNAELPVLLDAAEMGSTDQSILFTFTKEKNKTFTLHVYGSGAAAEFHPKIQERSLKGNSIKTALPLVFSGIKQEQLSVEFFLKLLSFRAYPKWDNGVAHTPRELYQFLHQEFDYDLSSSPLLSSTPETNGEWENFELFFSHRQKIDSLGFKKTLYLVRRQALIDVWSRYKKDFSKLKLNRDLAASLQMACQVFSDDALFLHKKGQIDEEEVQRVYATVFEIQTVLNTQARQAQALSHSPSFCIPQELRTVFQQMMQELRITSQDMPFLKDLFLAFLGEEIEESIDALLTELRPFLAEPISARRADTAPSISASFSVDAFKQYAQQMRLLRPSLLHFYRICIWTKGMLFKAFYRGVAARLLLALLQRAFPPFSRLPYLPLSLIANLVIEYGLLPVSRFLPKKLLETLATFYDFYQETLSYIGTRIACLAMKKVAELSFDKEELAAAQLQIKKTIMALTREGEISFNVSSVPPSARTLFISPAQPRQESLTGRYERVMPAVATFKRIGGVQSSQEIIAKLVEIFSASERMRTRKEIYFYLKRELFILPIPHPNDQGEWDKIENPEDCIELLYALATRFDAAARAEGYTVDVGQKVILLYAIEAIVDRLARRCDQRIELAPNGCELAVFMSNPSLRLNDPKWVEKLEAVAFYFGFDAKKTYEIAEINKKRGECLFNFESLGTWRPSLFTGTRFVIQLSCYGLFLSKEGRYYRALLKDPIIKKKMAVWGAHSHWEQMSLLFRDPSLKDWKDKRKHSSISSDEVQELSLGTKEFDKRKGILPRTFYCLRSLHFLSTRSVVSSVADQESFYGTTKADIRFTPREIGFSFPFKVVNEIAQFATTLLHTISFDFFRKLTLVSNLFIEKNLSTEFLFKRNKELLLQIRMHAFRNTYKIPEFWSMWLFGLGQKKTEEEILRSSPIHRELPLHLSQALEMVSLYPRDQIVRALAFFGEKRELLKEPQYRLLFDFFFHRFRALSLQLKEGFIENALCHFFKDAIEGFDAEEALEPLLFLVKIAEETRRWIPELPSFRGKLRELLTKENHYHNFGNILSTLLSTYREIEQNFLFDFLPFFYL